MKSFKTAILYFLTLLLSLFLLPLRSQGSETLTGTVTTGAGAPVPNAAVTIRHVDTGASQRVLAGPDGTFTVSGLAPGAYIIEVEAPGYKRLTQRDLQLVAGRPIRVTLLMPAGDSRETVDVKATPIVVQGDSAEMSRTFSAREIRELPIIDRNYQELIGLMPGITPPGASLPLFLDPQRNRLYHANGQSYLANNWELNGVDNNEPASALSVRVSPIESVQTMNIRTANYPAELGRAGGGIVNILRAPGTNALHGSVFWFNSLDEFRAREVFSPEPNPKPQFRWNQFGAEVGGPIVPDSLFFSGAYEGNYMDYQRPVQATVPTAAFRAGDFSEAPGFALFDPANAGRTAFSGATIPPNRVSPLAQALLPFVPLPNQPGVENNLLALSPLRNDNHRLSGRLDYRWEETTSFFLNYGYSRYFTSEQSPLGPVIGPGAESRLRSHVVSLGGSHIFSPTLLTDARVGYNRYENRLNSLITGNPLAGATFPGGATFPSFTGSQLPNIDISGLLSLGSQPGLPMRSVDNTFHFANTWGWTRGRHAFKFGGDVRRIRVDGFSELALGPGSVFRFLSTPTISPASPSPYNAFANSFASFLLGVPSVATQTFQVLSPSYRTTQVFGFVGDTFQAAPRLTLELGVRYEVYAPTSPASAGRLSSYDPLTNTLRISGVEGVDDRAGIDWDLNNFAPRFGFAFRAAEKAVVRGGYSISYFPGTIGFQTGSLYPSLVTIQQGVPGATGLTPSLTTPPGSAPPFPTTGTVTPPPNQLITFVPTKPKTPYVQMYNFTVQKQLGDTFLVDVGYVGTLGRQLPYRRELNAALPGTGLAGMPLLATFGRTASTILYDTGSNNNYHSLQAGVSKRFGKGLSFHGSYTYSKALDVASDASLLIDNTDRRRNYGPADYDRTHMFSFSHVWAIPVGTGSDRWNQGAIAQAIGGWQLDGILRWVSGAPFTVTADPALCNCPGTAAVYADVVGPVRVSDGIGSGDIGNGLWFDTSAFRAPAPGTSGNAGRNSLRGPGFFTYNLSLFRSFSVRERMKVEFRGEGYNLTNTPMFANPVSNVNSANFGRIVSTLAQTNHLEQNGGSRQFNLSLRFVF